MPSSVSLHGPDLPPFSLPFAWFLSPQAGESFAFNMTWRPTPALLARCKRHVEEETGVLDIPMRVTVPDQVLPVEFHVRINLTTSDLVFDPPSLDFGNIVMGQAGGINMRITNKSALPQKIGFLNQPPGVKVRPPSPAVRPSRHPLRKVPP